MTVAIYVPDVSDFKPLIDAVRTRSDVKVETPRAGYWQILSPDRISFSRKELRLRTALWFSMLTGGYRGRVTAYSKDALTIEGED